MPTMKEFRKDLDYIIQDLVTALEYAKGGQGAIDRNPSYTRDLLAESLGFIDEAAMLIKAHTTRARARISV